MTMNENESTVARSITQRPKYIINHDQGVISHRDILLKLAGMNDPMDILVSTRASGSLPFDDPVIAGQLVMVVEEDVFMMWDINGSERERVLLSSGDIIVVSCTNKDRKFCDLDGLGDKLRILGRGGIATAGNVTVSHKDDPAEDVIMSFMDYKGLEIAVYDGPASHTDNIYMRSDTKGTFALSKKRYLSPHRPVPGGIKYRAFLNIEYDRDFLVNIVNKPRLRIYTSFSEIIDDLRAVVGMSDDVLQSSLYGDTFEIRTTYKGMSSGPSYNTDQTLPEIRGESFREVSVNDIGEDAVTDFEDRARRYVMCYIMDMNTERSHCSFEHVQVEDLYRFAEELQSVPSGNITFNRSPVIHIKHLLDDLIKSLTGKSKVHAEDLVDLTSLIKDAVEDDSISTFGPWERMGFALDHEDDELFLEIRLPAQFPEQKSTDKFLQGEHKKSPLAELGFRIDVNEDSTEYRTQMFLKVHSGGVLQAGSSGPHEKLLINLEEASDRTIEETLGDLDSLF